MFGSRPVEERFWEKVQVGDENECWPWLGARSEKGYGFIWDGCLKRAHRVCYELHYGAIPDGYVVCHSCDYPPCNNPQHLFSATQTENLADASRKGRFPLRVEGGGYHSAKLTPSEVKEIRRLRANEGRTYKKLGDLFGVEQTTVRDIIHGRTWTNV